MGKRRSPEKASDREKKWEKIFNALVKLSQNLQNDRQILEERVEYLQGCIYQMKMEQKVDSLKAELVMGLKERECIVLQHRYENTENDVDDFRKWCDYLVQKCSGTNDMSVDTNKGESSGNKSLRDEVRKLKREIEEYKLEKNSEISALLAEKTFVWNQYKQMETSLTQQLRKKCDEAENANEKVHMLVSRADELQMSNEKLSANVTKMESESIQKDEEIVKLRKEIEKLKSRSGSAPTLLRCRADDASSSRRGKTSSTTGRSRAKVKKESDPSQTTDKGSCSLTSKRKAVDVIIIPDTPKLFTSSFKVPKLKN